MSMSLLEAAFEHHVWATIRLIDVCLGLTSEQLETVVPGTRGPIHETLRHIVAGDAEDLFILTGEPAHRVDADGMSLEDARTAIERNGSAWATYLARSLDPDEMVGEVDDDDGYERAAPIGFRLAATLDHGSDHRSQVSTALTTLGVEPPKTDVYDFGVATGRVIETMPGA
jgi:uncharacterized damage-inducible protein DinB